MLRFRFGVWAAMFMILAFSACGNSEENDKTYVPPTNIAEALKQLYPSAQNIEWEMQAPYYVADCWVSGQELNVWFDANANWLMTEAGLDSVDQLVPAVYTAFINSQYNSWVVTDVFLLTFPMNPTESVIQVQQGSVRHALFYSQDGGLLHDKDISSGDDMIWPPTVE